MMQGSIDIDRMVREVLAAMELQAGGGNVPGEAKTGSRTDLVIDCRVVTLSQLEGRLGAIRRLVVPRQAVITPAVRDELRRRSISLEFASQATAETSGQLRLVLVTSGKKPDPTSLASDLSIDGVEIVRRGFDCAIQAVEHLATEVRKHNTLGLMLTRHVAAALCLANRHAGVRGVTAVDARSVSAAAAAVGANLLLIDPGEVSAFRLRQAAVEFCCGGVRPCPENLRKELA